MSNTGCRSERFLLSDFAAGVHGCSHIHVRVFFFTPTLRAMPNSLRMGTIMFMSSVFPLIVFERKTGVRPKGGWMFVVLDDVIGRPKGSPSKHRLRIASPGILF
eukprot:5082891-Pyramimonas_sp.AAC.2